MTPEKITEVIDRYERYLTVLHGPEMDHLRTMLPKMRVLLEEGRREKLMRWLGFVQGVLWSERIYTLDELKSHNKPNEEEPGQEFDWRKAGLVPALNIPPRDCTNHCSDGPCDCSGEWQVRAFSFESARGLVEQIETLRKSNDLLRREADGEYDMGENARRVAREIMSERDKLKEQLQAAEKQRDACMKMAAVERPPDAIFNEALQDECERLTMQLEAERSWKDEAQKDALYVKKQLEESRNATQQWYDEAHQQRTAINRAVHELDRWAHANETLIYGVERAGAILREALNLADGDSV